MDGLLGRKGGHGVWRPRKGSCCLDSWVDVSLTLQLTAYVPGPVLGWELDGVLEVHTDSQGWPAPLGPSRNAEDAGVASP